MRSISNEFAALLAANHTLLMKATLTLADSTVLNLTSEDFMAGSARFEQAVSSDGSFDLGGAIVGTMSVTLANHNGRFDSYDLDGTTIVPYVGKKLANNNYEWLRLGTYDVIKPDSYGGTIGITCSDVLNRLARHKYSELSVTYPIYPQALLSAIVSYIGLSITYEVTPVNNAVPITRAPDSDMTLLDAAGYLAQMMGYWLVGNSTGNVTASWYDTSAFAPGGTPYEVEDAFSTSVMTVDVTITGVQVTETDEVTLDADGNEVNGRAGGTYLSGTSDYCLTIPYNPFIAYGTGQTVAAGLFSRVGGMSFRPYTNSMPCDPRIEVGDALVVTDRRGNTHNAYATGVILKPDGAMDTRCTAKAPASNSNLSASPLSMAVTAVKASVERSSQVADAAKAIATATDQYFWEDTNGVHVSTENKVAAGVRNILINSLGIILRERLNNLAALAAGDLSFFDGLGNNTSNIVARFGSSGAQIGSVDGTHLTVDSDSVDVVDGSSNTLLTMGADTGALVALIQTALEALQILVRDSSGTSEIYLHKTRSQTLNDNAATLGALYGDPIQGTAGGGGDFIAYASDDSVQASMDATWGDGNGNSYQARIDCRAGTQDNGVYVRGDKVYLDDNGAQILGTDTDGTTRANLASLNSNGNIILGSNANSGATRIYGNNVDVVVSSGGKFRMGTSAPVVQETKSATISSTAAGANATGSVSVAKTGYTPVGFQWWWSAGTRQNFFNDYGCHIEGTTFYWRFCNVGSSAANGTLQIKVLYVRDEML